MEIQSSYIFLKNTYNPDSEIKKENENYVLELGNTVVGFIRKCYPKIEELKDYDDIFKTIYSINIEMGKYTFEVTFNIYHVVNIAYLDVCVNGKNKAKIIACLEEIQEKLLQSGIRRFYIDIISYDAISEYYCNKIYSYFNKLERNLRKLFFNIFALNFGGEFCDKAIEKSQLNSLKSIIKQDTKEMKGQYKKEYGCRSNAEVEMIMTIQRLFYAFDYNDMKTFLFDQTWNDYDKQNVLKQHKDLSVLSDCELRELIEGISPRTNWDRFFREKVVLDDIRTIFNNIRLYRNTVAHFKFFDKTDYSTCLKVIRKLNSAVIKAIKVTEEEDFDKKNEEYIRVMLMPVIKSVDDVMRGFKGEIADSVAKFWGSDFYSTTEIVTKVLAEVEMEQIEEVEGEDKDEQ